MVRAYLWRDPNISDLTSDTVPIGSAENPVAEAVYDDGVLRCPLCAYEVAYGECINSWCDFTSPWDYNNKVDSDPTPSVDEEPQASFCKDCSEEIIYVNCESESDLDLACINCGLALEPAKAAILPENPAIEMRRQQQAEILAEVKDLASSEPPQPTSPSYWDDTILRDLYIFGHRYAASREIDRMRRLAIADQDRSGPCAILSLRLG